MTDQPEPVDLSPLDPARRPEWEARVAATRQVVSAAVRRRAATPRPLDIVGAWARPILAAAAVLLVLLGGADALLHHVSAGRAGGPGEARRLALLSESSVAHGRVPTGAELRGALRGRAP
jgi:hypothetical protein